MVEEQSVADYLAGHVSRLTTDTDASFRERRIRAKEEYLKEHPNAPLQTPKPPYEVATTDKQKVRKGRRR